MTEPPGPPLRILIRTTTPSYGRGCVPSSKANPTSTALAPEAAARVVGYTAEPGPGLSEREVEVVRLLARGHSNRAVAGALFLAGATVKTHLVRIYRKLGTENRAATVSEAVRRGLIDVD
ncbi:ATP/maltotriose-dependent transcriptional regulator MalT [Streptomyces sp. V4I2]|nr:ATP/maltotriose-dependent transcriptional regulator MalT [Streptomyces sp. V4I2]